MKQNLRGFTLIEAVVALTIFAVMATGLTKYITGQASQIAYLTDKTLAAIVATNAIDTMRATQWPPLGSSQQEISMAGKQWQVSIEVKETTYVNLLQVNVSVVRADNQGAQASSGILSAMVGFIGLH